MNTKNNNSFIAILSCTLLTLLFLAGSCGPESLTGLTQDNLTVADLKNNGKAVERPVAIDLEGIDDQDGVGGTFTAQMTHLGRVSGTTSPGSFLPNPDGTFTFTSLDDDVIIAANGDLVYSRSLLIFEFISETTAHYTGTITFVGGTGRFDGATGSMQVENGVYEIIGFNDLGGGRGTFTHNGAGTITY